MQLHWVQVALFLAVLISQGSGYTDKEQEALKKFRNEVQKDLYQDYMKEDLYLARWLQAKKWNVNDAVAMLKKSIKWRKENKADTAIVDLRQKCSNIYPIQLDVVTKTGEPAVLLRVSDWDIRRKVLSGKIDDLTRCLVWFLEYMTEKVRGRSGNGTATHVNAIFDIGGFSMQQHACVQCLPLYMKMLSIYEANYPGMLRKGYFINTPVIFQTNFKAAKVLMSEPTQKAVVVYGFEKDKWQKALKEDFTPDQLPAEYGGTRPRVKPRRSFKKAVKKS